MAPAGREHGLAFTCQELEAGRLLHNDGDGESGIDYRTSVIDPIAPPMPVKDLTVGTDLKVIGKGPSITFKQKDELGFWVWPIFLQPGGNHG